MTKITLDDGTDGLDGFPAGFTPVGRDDLGDPLAVDAAGKVWSFAHGRGDWSARSPAFESVEALRAFVAFQSRLETPEPADVAALRARREEVESFRKANPRSPFAREAARAALEELKEALADARFASSARGRGLAARQALGARCEQALREAGVPGAWLVRAHASDARALVVVGTPSGTWDEAAIRKLLAPLVEPDFELRFPTR